MKSILVLASDSIGSRMAGTGIRYWNLARVLAGEHQVTLAAPSPVDLPAPDGVALRWFDPEATPEESLGAWQAKLIAAHDIVVAPDIPYYHCDAETLRSRHLVIDLYAPAILEKLEYARIDPERGESDRADDVRSLDRLLSLGDFFICASERQRDFWLGALALAGRLNLEHARSDPELRTLVDTVSFGLPERPPSKTGAGPRSTIQGIDQDDFVLLWNGGLWNWLDPLTAIEAVDGLRQTMPNLRLIFMGARNPLHADRTMEIAEKAKERASQSGLLGQHVFFNDWVEYEARQNWLLEADAAISLHYPTAEARLSFRTRMLDLFWCRVPVIASAGDVLADVAKENNVGLIVPPGDVVAVQQAIREIAEPGKRESMRDAFQGLAERYTWGRVAEPLLAFSRSPDRVAAPRGVSPKDEYIHHLERLYTETAEYAQHVERELAEQQAAIEASISSRATRLLRRIIPGSN